jgi:hypothetical protein
MKKITFTLFLLTLLILPVTSLEAQATDVPAEPPANTQVQTAPRLDYSGFVKCDGVKKTDGTEPYRQRECNFAALVDTIIKLINWAFYVSIPIATVVFAYGGVLYMTGQQDKIKQAKKMFVSAGIGFIIMITAWFGMRAFIGWFVEPDSGASLLVK